MRNLVLFLVILAGQGWVCAQTPRLPSDIELRSTYCLEILERQKANVIRVAAAMVKSDSRSSSTAEEGVRTSLAQLAPEIRRLEAYLIPRRAYLDQMAIVTARESAVADFNQGRSVVRVCDNKCTNLPEASQAMACFDSCMNTTPPMNRIKACEKVDWLPF